MAIVSTNPNYTFSIDISYIDGATTTVDAAGESAAVIGMLRLPTGTGSKTLSQAGGGSIYWRTGTPATFSNATTKLRIGLQDVSTSTGLEDGTFDVYAELTGGVATVAANTFIKSTMTSGTKTVADGDLLAIGIEMTAKGGSDSVLLRRTLPSTTNVACNLPYGTADTGTLAKTSASWLFAVIEFDDGTIGWIEGATLGINSVSMTNISFNSGSTPDEYCGAFTPLAPMQISAIGMMAFNIATAEDFELILYSDPFGTPAVVQAVAMDPDVLGAPSTASMIWAPVTNVTLALGTTYAVAIRPTTANNISVTYFDLLTGNAAIKKVTPFANDVRFASRTNQTGAFTEVQTYNLPLFGISVSGYDNGAGGGGTTMFIPVE